MVGWQRTDLIFLFLVLWESSAITNRRSIVKHNGNVRNFRHIGGSSTSFTDWEIGLRESVHQALLREGYQDPNLRERILRAPLIGKQDSATPFGDVAVLARGQLYALAGGNFAFVQDPYTNDCDECHNARRRRMCGAYQCEVWRPQHHERLLGLWNVKRLRHRSNNNYHYEIQYTISPLSSTITEAYVTRNGRYDYTIPGHVFVIRNNVISKNLATAFPEIYNKRIPHENFNPEILIAVDSDGNQFFLHSYPAFFTALPVSPTYQQDYSTKDLREIDLYKKLIQALADKTSTTKKEEGPFKVSLNHLGDTTKPSREKYPTTTQSMTPLTPVYVPVIEVPETKATQPSIVLFTKPNIVSSTKPIETKVQSVTTTEVPKIHKVTPSMKTMVHFFVPIGEELMTTKPMEKISIITKPTQKTTTEESAAFLFPDFKKPTPEPNKMSKPTKTIVLASTDADFLFPKPTKTYDMLASKPVPLPSATSLTTVTIRPWQTMTSTTTSLTITPQLSSTIESTTTSSSTKVPLLTLKSTKPTNRSTFPKTTKESTTTSRYTQVPLLTFTSTKPTTRSTLKFRKPTLTTSATTSEIKKQQLTSRFAKPPQSSTKLSKLTFLSKTTKPYSTTMKSSTKTATKLSSLTPRMEKSVTTSPRFTMSTSGVILPAPTSESRRPVTTTSTSVRPSSTSQVTETFSTTKMTQPEIKRPKTTKASISMATQPDKEFDTKKPLITKITESPITIASFTVLPTSTRSTAKMTVPQYVTLSREFPTQTTKTIFDLTEPQRTTEEAREATDTEFEIVPDMIPTEPMHTVTQSPLANKAEQEQLPSPNKETETTIPYFTINYFDLEQTKKETINVTSTVATTKITEVPTTTTETNILIMLSTTKTVEEITEKVGTTAAVPKATNILDNMQIQEHTKEIMETSERQKETEELSEQTTHPLLETTQKIDKETVKTTQDSSRMNETTTEVFPITSPQPNIIFISTTTTKPATKKIYTTVKSNPTSGKPMRPKISTSNFLTDGDPVNEPINVNPVHKDYNEDDIFGATKLTKKTTISTTLKPTESDLAIQLFNRKRRRKAKASSKVIFSNFYEVSTAALPVETSSQENSNEPQLLTSQSVETSISFEVNKRKKVQSPLSTKATVDEIMEKDGYTVYKAEFPKQLNISTTENSKKMFNDLAVQLVNHARTIDYLSQMENRTSIKPKYKRRNYRPKYKINKEKHEE